MVASDRWSHKRYKMILMRFRLSDIKYGHIVPGWAKPHVERFMFI